MKKTFLTTSSLLLVLLFVFLYVIFDWSFVRCKGKNCSPISANMISRVNNVANYTEASNKLAEYDIIAGNAANLQVNVNAALTKMQANFYEKSQILNNSKQEEINANVANATVIQVAANVNTKRLEAEKTLADDNLKVKQAEANLLAQDVTKNTNEAIFIRTQYSNRYSTRMIWIFLTAFFSVLFLAAIACSWSVVYRSKRISNWLKHPADSPDDIKNKSLSETWRWTIYTSIGALAFSIFIWLIRGRFGSIMLPMLQQSLLHENVNELDDSTLMFFIILGFVGSIFLVSSSCVIFRAAVDTDEKAVKTVVDTNANPATSVIVADDEKKLANYGELLKYLRTILYVGTFMLFIGILRLMYLNQWHLAFVSNTNTSDLFILLNNFLKSSMSVQGAFYTLLLTAIYLPPVFWIKEKVSLMRVPEKTLMDKGIQFSYTDIIFRLLAIVSPLIAGAFGSSVEWLGFFKGG